MGATVDGVVAQFAARGMPDITVHDLRGDGKKHVYGPKKKAWYRLFDWVAPSGVVWLSGVFGTMDQIIRVTISMKVYKLSLLLLYENCS